MTRLRDIPDQVGDDNYCEALYNHPMTNLEDEIAAAKAKMPKEVPPIQPVSATSGLGIGLTLVGTISLCSAMGVAIDRFFDTNPWGLIIFFLLGLVTGFYSVYMASKGL